MSGARDEIWLVSNLAPPVHGVSMFNAALLEELERRGEPVRVFRIGSSRARSIGRFSIVKALRDGGLIARFLAASLWRRLRGGGRAVLYFTPSQGGPAVFRDAVVATIGRACFDRVIGHVHGCSWLGRYREGGLAARAMRHALASCDQVICLGDRFTRAMRTATGIDCVSVDNGAPATRGGKARSWPSNGAPLTLLYLGSFILSKGLWAAAEAAVLLHGRGRSVRLQCAGSWRKEAERVGFERHFREAMKRGVIQFLGPVDELGRAKALLEANILVLPTRYPHEGQPLVLIEAMSAGVVPITTDQGGIPDLMSFAGAERLVASSHDSGHGVARTVEALANEPDVYEALSWLCLERSRTHLTMERCVTDILTVIRGDADPQMEGWESKQAAV
jgi:glycosyltransferase involved in cell wall biosynthesis